jgi:hypothetical protein
MQTPTSNDVTRTALALAILLIVALPTLFEPPYAASDLSIAPDAVEYSTAAWRLVREGRYAITINGTPYPPRYPPGFALFALVPVYGLTGADVGGGIYGVLVWSLIGIAAAFAIGRRLGGVASGILAGAAVLLLPDFRHYSQMIMSDATSAAVTLVLLLVYLRLTASPGMWRRWLVAGFISAIAVSIRPTALSATLPFLILAWRNSPRQRLQLTGGLFSLPILLLSAFQLMYNFHTFGSPLRSGYKFWCPVPYDYPRLTFGFSHLLANTAAAWRSSLIILAAVVTVAYFALRRSGQTDDPRSAALRDSLGFILLSATPLTLFHLLYFYPETRFFLPATASLAAIAGAMLGILVQSVSNRSATAAAAAALGLVVVIALSNPARTPTRRHTVDCLDDTLPRNAVLISSVDPVYLDFFLNRDAERVVLPLSRQVEYASKSVAPTKIPILDPPPAHAFDHRCPGIRNGSGYDVIASTASEAGGIRQIDSALAAGIAVFLDATHISRTERSIIYSLQSRYEMRRRAEGVYELTRPTLQLR